MRRVVIFLFIFLSSCTFAQIQPEAIPPLPDLANPTLTSTAESLPTPLLTPSPQKPTQIMEASLESTEIVFDFPRWLQNPDTLVLAALKTNENDQTEFIDFINGESGEIFEFDPGFSFSGFFWVDNTHIGFTSIDKQQLIQFDLISGKSKSETLDAKSVRLLTNDWKKSLVIFNHPESGENTYDYYDENNCSLTKEYKAYWTNERRDLLVKNTYTDEVVWELNLPKYWQGMDVVWSPVEPNQFAIVYGYPDDINGFITDQLTLAIIDVFTGEVFNTFNDDFGEIEWSPDGKMILFLDPLFRYRMYGYPFQGAPGLLFLETGEIKYLRSIPNFVPQEYSLLTTGLYRWGKDSETINFTYVYASSEERKMIGNLCVYSLISGQINCPTENQEVLQGNSIIAYDFSPDQELIHFCYTSNTILNDFAAPQVDVLLNHKGELITTWTSTYLFGGPGLCSQDFLWRP